MEQVLAFLSDLILLTFGLAVVAFWIVMFSAVAIEIWDFITGNNQDDQGEEL